MYRLACLWGLLAFAMLRVIAQPQECPRITLPANGLNAYRHDLTSLQRFPAETAVPQALATYRQRYAHAPLAWREEGFRQFRTFHQALVLQANRRFQQQSNAIIARWRRTGGPFPFTALQRLAKTFNANAANQRAGFQAVYQGEAMWAVTPRYGFYVHHFGPYLSPASRDFLMIEDTEQHQDVGQQISMDELGRRVRNRELYLERYPESPYRTQVQAYYRAELSAFLYGTDENPHYSLENGQLRPGITEAMAQYVARYPEKASAREVAEVLALYARHNNTRSEALLADLDAFRRLHDPAIATGYFPATVGDAWRYATGGFENAGFLTTVAYRQGTRAQFNVQDTATSGYVIYEFPDDNVVMVYHAGEAMNSGNHLSVPNAMNQLMLQSPIRVNRSWDSNGLRHTIVQTHATMTILGKPYIDVIEIVRRPRGPGKPAYAIHDFYALGVGLIRSDYLSTNLLNQALLGAYRPAPLPAAAGINGQGGSATPPLTNNRTGYWTISVAYPRFTAPGSVAERANAASQAAEQSDFSSFLAEAQKEVPELRTYGSNVQYYLAVTPNVTMDTPSISSGYVEREQATGGANAMRNFRVINYGNVSGTVRALQLQDLFKRGVNGLEEASRALLQEFARMEKPPSEVASGNWTHLSPEQANRFVITDAGLLFLFDKGDIGVSAEGAIKVLVPYAALPGLNHEGVLQPILTKTNTPQ